MLSLLRVFDGVTDSMQSELLRAAEDFILQLLRSDPSITGTFIKIHTYAL